MGLIDFQFVTFFVYLSCFRNRTNEDWITAENITNEEKEVKIVHFCLGISFSSDYSGTSVDVCF